ncbi:FecR family protein [Nitrosospira multiformis]|uniref:FecR family protein n=1 Tax=Nitrosospira multiformis TaxID=1231 RepID=A0A2T5IGX5_9PROT|nr:FecR domain-containing protein [Nitrosospira multiformis]PTQ83084.1 FecR family protein [Nitrosospira multiformis]
MTASLLITVVAVSALALDVHAAELCRPSIALMVSVQGAVELRRVKEANWQAAKLNVVLCPGDTVRVAENSRAALRLSNESTLRLDQKTVLTLAAPARDRAALVELVTGNLFVITRTPKPFRVKTRLVTADIEGTEFFIGTDEDRAKLVIYEGTVSASNEQGSVSLVSNEAASVLKGEAPRKEKVVRPTDAVQWTLYYPTIISYRLDEKLTAEPVQLALRASLALYRQGRLPEALAALDEVPETAHSPRFLTYRAGLLLSVGRVEEGRTDIAQALNLDPRNSDAYALQAIIAVVQNDKDQALNLATKAVELDQESSTARLALSYTQQAHFQIEATLESVQKAAEFDPQNALIWARIAELHMSAGYLERALEAAERAVDLNPNLSKTQTVLGFAHLTRIDTKAAKAAFAKAIELDSADPMPRLGMGLAKLREGDVEAGRMEMEIAAALDPMNSLIRSYLGKAYFEEKRYNLAEAQFDMGKALDPNDPTPWFYDAIQKQTQNRPVEALWDLQKSIDLNDNRAVYRSKLLLDRDQAARGSSLARIYDNLGFEKRALMETAKSLSFDPGSHSSHRFLSDAYRNVPWHEIARASELLQAQLLQPINVNPVQPHLTVADLNIITSTGPTVGGFNEFTPLVERNKPQLVASGILGNHGTIGDEAVLSALYERASVSIGQFHYNTNGFRENNDQKHNVYNAFFQYAVTPRFNVQAEVRTRKTENGDLLLRFDQPLESNFRRELAQDTARIGARASLSPTQDFIVSAMYNDRRTGPNESLTKDFGYQVETQYLFRGDRVNFLAGIGTFQFQVDSQDIHFKKWRNTGYFYMNFNPIKNLSWTLGLGYDSLKDQENFEVNKFNPKLGMQWNITANLRLRLAWFETVKSFLIANQTIEPTQVAGFNQLFDDVNGTKARRKGIGLDARVATNLYGGLEASVRDLAVPFFLKRELSREEKQQERVYSAYLYWIPHPNWAIRGESRFEKFTRAPSENLDIDDPFRIETLSAPLSLNYFNPSGIFATVTTTYVRQELRRMESLEVGEDGDEVSVPTTVDDNFVLLDAVLGYRFPNRRGIVSLEGRNLLDENFFFKSNNFQANEITAPRFIPSRTFFLRLTLNF